MQHSNLRNIDLNLLVILESLLITNNVTAAAKEIGLSQPAVSRSLSRLREIFNDQLLVRSGQGMVPTPFATSLMGDLSGTLELVRGLLAVKKFEPASATTRFRINAPDAAISIIFSKVLKPIRKLAPGMSFLFTNFTTNRLSSLASGEIDFAIDLYEEVPSGFQRNFLIDDRLVCIARRDNSPKPKRFDREKFITNHHVEMQTSSGGLIEQFLRNKGIKLNYAVRVTNFTSAVAIVAETDLITILPYNLAQLLGKIFQITIYEPPFDFPRHPLDVVWHERVNYSPPHIWLRDQINKVVSEEIIATS